MANVNIAADWSVNRGNLKARIALLLFRLVRRFWVQGGVLRIVGLPFFVVYRVMVDYFWGIELGWRVDVGPRLRIFHGIGLVVNPNTVIGSDCILRHCTTIGVKNTGGAPLASEIV